MMLSAYRTVTTLGKPFIEAFLNRRRARGKEDPARAPERRGIASRPRPNSTLVWVHAASVGESVSVLPLIDRLHDMRSQCHFLVTTGTVTSARIMENRLPERAIHQFVPVDRPSWVAVFLDYWQPDLALWVESEFWPNLLTMAHERGLPMILVNARISPTSFRNWKRFPRAIEKLLDCFTLCLAQSEGDAEKLKALGAANVALPGNLKFAAPPLPADPDEVSALEEAIGDRPVWLAASTHPGEDEIILAAHRIAAEKYPDLLTVIVPRHPVRGPNIAELSRAAGLASARRSAADKLSSETEIYIADTVGELGLFYRAAPVSFIGGSLVPHGGQNMLEAAKLGSAVIFGPHTVNFAVIAGGMLAANAARKVETAEELALTLTRLLEDETTRGRQADAARRIAEDQQDVLGRVIEKITPHIKSATRGGNDAAA